MTGAPRSSPAGVQGGIARPVRTGLGVAVTAVLTAALVAMVGACGVTTQSSPQTIDSPAAPTVAPPTGATTRVSDIYLVRGDRLVASPRPIADPRTLRRVLESLLSGTTAVENDDGLRSVLPSTVLLRSAEIRGDTAYLDLSEGLSGIDSGDQAYAIAQLVYTATAWPGVRRVQLLVEGELVQVPRADGVLTGGPVGRSDYASLLA